jgi:nucleotide-binding universal stress UspA family protein
MFRRVLVVTDGSAGGLATDAFAAELAQEFGTEVRTFSLDGSERPVGVSSELARDHHLARTIAQAADTFGADVILMGLGRVSGSHLHSPRRLRAQLTRSTSVPVMLGPRERTREVSSRV